MFWPINTVTKTWTKSSSTNPLDDYLATSHHYIWRAYIWGVHSKPLGLANNPHTNALWIIFIECVPQHRVYNPILLSSTLGLHLSLIDIPSIVCLFFHIYQSITTHFPPIHQLQLPECVFCWCVVEYTFSLRHIQYSSIANSFGSCEPCDRVGLIKIFLPRALRTLHSHSHSLASNGHSGWTVNNIISLRVSHSKSR